MCSNVYLDGTRHNGQNRMWESDGVENSIEMNAHVLRNAIDVIYQFLETVGNGVGASPDNASFVPLKGELALNVEV